MFRYRGPDDLVLEEFPIEKILLIDRCWPWVQGFLPSRQPCDALDVIAAGVTVLSAVGRSRRMMVFSGVASHCEERGALPAGTNFEIADTLVPAGTDFPPKRSSGSVS